MPKLLERTNLEDATLVSTVGDDGQVEDERNLVVATHLPVLGHDQLLSALIEARCTSG